MTISWPPISKGASRPIWTGQDFFIDGKKVPLLCYHETSSGWSNDLTKLHEDVTGRDHYIDHASRQNAIHALMPILKLPNPHVLEIGCSSGYLLQDLLKRAKHATIVGSDYIKELLYTVANRLRGIPIVQFDITQCPFEDSQFDGIVMLNVLEHIKDDTAALKQVYRILKPGGIAVIEVPAGPHLYDFYDKHLMHYRRYRLQDLTSLSHSIGFKIKRTSHLGFFIYPLFAMVKKRNIEKGKKMSTSEIELCVSQQIKRGNTKPIMHAIMKLELIFGRFFDYPWGIRCIVILEK